MSQLDSAGQKGLKLTLAGVLIVIESQFAIAAANGAGTYYSIYIKDLNTNTHQMSTRISHKCHGTSRAVCNSFNG